MSAGCSTLTRPFGIPGVWISTKYGTGNLNYEIYLSISCKDSVIYRTKQPVEITCKISNWSKVKIAMSHDFRTNSSFFYGEHWVMNFINIDSTKEKYIPSFLGGSGRFIGDKDYVIINPGEVFKFDFDIYFNDLYGDGDIPGEQAIVDKDINKTYGTYYIQLYYEDVWCRHKKALRNVLVSNVLKIRYLEKE